MVTSVSVDIIVCNIKTSIAAKDYTIAVEKNIYFEVSYAPMLINSTTRQDTITMAHLLHIKGKSKVILILHNSNIHLNKNCIYFFFSEFNNFKWCC